MMVLRAMVELKLYHCVVENKKHHHCCSGSDLTLEGAMLRAAGCDEIEWHMGRPTDVLMRESSTGALVASTHHPLADKIGSPDYKDQQDDGDDRADGVGPCVRDGGRRHILYREQNQRDRVRDRNNTRVLTL